MTSPGDIGRQFNRLIFAALQSPATVDRGELLSAADAFLIAAQGGDPTCLEMARRMAHRAMDWCVLGTPEDYHMLKTAVELFGMYNRINAAIDRMA